MEILRYLGLGEFWEWLGINTALDTVLPWLTANGSLSLLLVVGVGMPVGLWLIHRSKIPVKIPGVQALKPVAVIMMLAIYLAMVAMAGVILWREGVAPAARSAGHGAAERAGAGQQGTPGPTGFDEPSGP